MRIPVSVLPVARSVMVALFVAFCVLVLGYLWSNAGGTIPLLTKQGYTVSLAMKDVDNLVPNSDVRQAGVRIGRVSAVSIEGGDAQVTLDIDPAYAPLHEGATVTIRNKTLIEETYADVADGSGAVYAEGATMPADAARPSVQLDDVLTSLDEPTREALGSTVRSLSSATEGSKDDISATMGGLGELGREGGTALSALAEQSQDLAAVTGNTTALLRALDTGQGRIADLVQDAGNLTGAVSENRADLEAVMRKLPGVLDTAKTASTSLTTLSESLAPVARNLDTAAPDLSAALQELPATSADLRGLVQPLDETLDRAPDTLTRVQPFSDATRQLIPTLQINLSDLNPTLGYLRPYGKDTALWFAGLSQTLGVSGDGNGSALRAFVVVNEKSVNQPLNTQFGPLEKWNPYPEAGANSDPRRSFDGEYPRIQEEPQPN
ncbi:MlaD family protein [Pseudonocardia sp. WMMC193]|uniref:MlaD family protein n=1 Tax=Pseudonocardia sp. WMMC193 TaxID=2911965 RepID=UPI001F397FD5|nr:MlaD family protein [Pseudonocardia sp. WMMC193]MCF7550725.1 MlaD family protein [Pseudonocardia sp. WMMC193]